MSHRYVKRLFLMPKQSFFLIGPRGTGKSTLIQRIFSNSFYVDLSLRNYEKQPEALLKIVQSQPSGTVIIIDEVQKVPELLSIAHNLREWTFILISSSLCKLKSVNWDKKMLHPFMAIELGDSFNLEDALQHGLLPLRFSESLSSYISLYIDEEIRAEGIIRNIDSFNRFLEVVLFSHGSILNISNIARECSVKRPTIQSWLSVLEDLLLTFQIPVFTKNAKRILTSHPKFYFFDTGICKVPTLEGLVAQHLRAWVDYTKEKHYLNFWRTKSGVEVDFVIHGPLGFWAIEVKNGDVIHPQDLRSLENFMEDYPEAQAILLYRGKEKLLKKNILCIPCEEFLRQLTPNQPIYQ